MPIVVHGNNYSTDGSELVGGYGIGIVSKIPVKHWDRLELKKSPFGMPIMIPSEG